MNEKTRIEVAVALTEYEADVVNDYAEAMGETLDEFLARVAGERAREIAYASDWDDGLLSDEEIAEFTNNYHDDRLIDFLRDARLDGDE